MVQHGDMIQTASVARKSEDIHNAHRNTGKIMSRNYTMN